MSTASVKSSRSRATLPVFACLRGQRRASARPRRSHAAAGGFSLVEVMVALGILAFASLSVAQLFAVATKANFASKSQTSTTMLAVAKMEQLKSLTWGFDQSSSNMGLPISDTTTDLSLPTPTGGGRGLNPSPASALDADTPGYVDYLDIDGTWVGNGGNPPAPTFYIRRWAITPLPTNPNNTLVFEVHVTTIRQVGMNQPGQPRWGQDAHLVSVKTRKAQ
jgi:prepilin-type N-terminal cleavage/methylation domain-containing protein